MNNSESLISSIYPSLILPAVNATSVTNKVANFEANLEPKISISGGNTIEKIEISTPKNRENNNNNNNSEKILELNDWKRFLVIGKVTVLHNSLLRKIICHFHRQLILANRALGINWRLTLLIGIQLYANHGIFFNNFYFIYF